MKIIFSFLLILISSTQLKSQMLESGIRLIHAFPHAGIYSSGIGNLGFDCHESIFNPIHNSDAKLKVFVTTNLNIDSGRSGSWSNILTFLPNFDLKYSESSFTFHFSYYTNLLLHQKSIAGTWVIRFPGQNTINSRGLSQKIFNNRTQLALSVPLGDYFTGSLGVFFNTFTNIIDFNDTLVKALDVKTASFQKIQFSGSLNLHFKNGLKSYILLRSQRSNVQLNPKFIELSDEISFANPYSVSFPGELSYGMQLPVTKTLKISTELTHQYLFQKSFSIRNSESIEKTELNILLSEISIGANYLFKFPFKLGIVLSRYVQHMDWLRPFYTTGTGESALGNVRNPMTFVFSSEYAFGKLLFTLHFQYSTVKYNLENISVDFVDQSKFIKIGFGTNLN